VQRSECTRACVRNQTVSDSNASKGFGRIIRRVGEQCGLT
jgi:hypothetical protein